MKSNSQNVLIKVREVNNNEVTGKSTQLSQTMLQVNRRFQTAHNSKGKGTHI